MGKRGYNIGEVSLILVILILLVAVGAYSVFADCPHGVQICGIRYDCGIDDEVCPDWFQAGLCCQADCPVTDQDCFPTVCAGVDILPTGAFSSASCSVATGTASDANCLGTAITVRLDFGGVTRDVVATGGSFTFDYSADTAVLAQIGDGLAHTISATAFGIDASCNPNGLDTTFGPVSINGGTACGYFNWVRGNDSGIFDVAWNDRLDIYRLNSSQDACVRLNGANHPFWGCIQGFNPGGNDNWAVCTEPSNPDVTRGSWFDIDSSQSACELCGVVETRWRTGGEAAPFGEYDTGRSTECCQDDAGEYLRSNPINGQNACCNLNTDIVNSTGFCIPYSLERPELGNTCYDGQDNDGNGYNDWDTASWSDPRRSEYHGDPGCPVGVVLAQVNDTDPFANSPIQVNCTVTTGRRVDSVYVFIDEDMDGVYDAGTDSDCGWPLGSDWYNGDTVASFISCNVGGSGTKRVVCDVMNDTTLPYNRSYQNGSAVWVEINVQTTLCDGYPQATCNSVPGCTWYDECNMSAPYNRWSAYPGGACVLSTTPNPFTQCNVAICSDTCSLANDDNCADHCGTGVTANHWYTGSSCNIPTCSCAAFTDTDCSGLLCGDGLNICQGQGTNTIREIGNSFVCVGPPVGCDVSGPMVDCPEPDYVCNIATNCSLQACGDSAPNNFRCHYDGSYVWTSTTVVLTETNCHDNYDNDCDGLVDCADDECEKDSDQICCEAMLDTNTPGDSGVDYGGWLFDAAGNTGTQQCCGDDANEWFWYVGSISDGGCCDAMTDCISTFAGSLGACYNLDVRAASDTALCGSDIPSSSWYYCNNTDGFHTNGEHIGSYYCSYLASDGGWKWRDSMPAENNVPNNNCFDGVDNDDDGEDDWDTFTLSVPSRGANHGDNGCSVGVTSISVNTATPISGGTIDITCGVSAGGVNVNSVYAYIDNDNNGRFNSGDAECGWDDFEDYWSGGNAFVHFINCPVGGTGNKRAGCGVYNSSEDPFGRNRSYQSGNDQTTAITVLSSVCSDYDNEFDCNLILSCDWYEECESTRSSRLHSSFDDPYNTGGACVLASAGAPTYSCDESICGETCDGSSSACADQCGTGDEIDEFHYFSTCDTASTCECTPFWVYDCSLNHDCNAASLTCERVSNTVIRQMGGNYSCAVGGPIGLGCEFSNTVLCYGPYTCGPGLECAVQSCGGVSYTCHRENGIWNWTITGLMPAVETNCSDNYNNNCAGGIDCLDATCTRDANPNCCLNITFGDTTTPNDHGLGWGSTLFDDPTNNAANPLCCGNNPSEWFFNFTPATACCDEPTDCVRYVPAGACENHDYPQGLPYQDEHCNNTEWNTCNLANNGDQSGTYYCGYNASDSGWRWRPNMPAEDCSLDLIDNDGDLLIDCLDHDDCDGVCPFCPDYENETLKSGSCIDDLDNDCDGPIDGEDSECPEGSGDDEDSDHRGCDDGIDNDEDGILDEDEAECADTCEGISDGRIMMWDNTTYPLNAFGAPCGVPFSEWEGSIPDEMQDYCCGNNVSEHYKNSTINTNPADDIPGFHACCLTSDSCVDAHGACQKGSEGVGDLTDCFDFEDNDCDGLTDEEDVDNCTGGTLTGFIFDEDGRPIGGAIVTASPPVMGTQYEKSSSGSNQYDGSYILTNPVVGTYNFIARKAGYDDNITKISITAGDTIQQNFTLRNGSCHADCTDYYGNCNPACDGAQFVIGTDANGLPIIDTCNFESVCAYRPKGFVVKEVVSTYPGHDEPGCMGDDCVTTIRQTLCCENEDVTLAEYPVILPRITGEVKDVRIVSRMVKRGTEWIKVNLAVWTEDEGGS